MRGEMRVVSESCYQLFCKPDTQKLFLMFFLRSLTKPDSEKHDITPTAAVPISIVPQKAVNEELVLAVSSRKAVLHPDVQTACLHAPSLGSKIFTDQGE